ncbi:MAG TPA: adenylate/guanylate cyclase domain-containing protein [Novosphingobium sp.]|nr:adenylate/guanylate cyclase domain-containing protein [Novosphingobium sp.]
MSAPAPAAQRWFGVVLMLLFCGLSLPFFMSSVGRGPTIVDGVADFGGAMSAVRPVEVAGEAQFEWRSKPLGGAFGIGLPGQWAGVRAPDGTILPDRGSATYRVRLRGLPEGRYRLYVPSMFGASRLSIDGVAVAQNGGFGPPPRYLIRPLEGDFQVPAGGGGAAVTLDVATSALRANGVDGPLVLGEVRPMQAWSAHRWAQEFFVTVALFLLGIIGAVIFLFRRSDRAPLYLAIMCFAFLPASLVAGFDNILALIAPRLDWPAVMAVAWGSGMIGVAALLANAHALFPAESPRQAYRALQALSAVFVVGLAATYTVAGSYAASRFAELQPAVFVAVLGYVVVVIFRAALRGRDGAAPLLLGVGIASLAILAVAAVATGELSADFARGANYAAFGAVALLFANLVVLAERWALAITQTERSNADLRELLEVSSSITSEIKLDALLRRIVGATSRFLGAARSSLFLHDAREDQLWSMVAEGVDDREIRIGAGEGLAGAAFTSGEPVIAADAYAHPSFKPEIDAQTGFRTGSLISMPITTREGRKLGVMQALNPSGGHAFGEGEVERMRAFAAQAAIAVDNATLFSEAVAARQYAESILASMSSGVVTLDCDFRIQTLNRAACEIFGVEQGALDGALAEAAVGAANAWLLDEIGEVILNGAGKVLLDVELTVAGGAVRSVNLSIVPLIDHDERTGAVVLVEDISEGKRLSGAMRRFMPQKVVEQVLARDDDLLFGTACRASVLFADIRGFTSMTEKLTPRETVDMLNEVFSELFEAVAETDGILDKYIGDAIMAVYGVPFAGEHDAENAVAAAVKMLEMVAVINEGRAAKGLAPLELGIGIATGEVIAGTIGSPKRMDYTVIGDSVNLAARLQELTKSYKAPVIVCERTAAAAGEERSLRELDTIRVRGREAEERIFEVMR